MQCSILRLILRSPCRISNQLVHQLSVSVYLSRRADFAFTKITCSMSRLLIPAKRHLHPKLYRNDSLARVYLLIGHANIVIESERVLTAPYAPMNLNTYLLSNSHLLNIIHRKSLPPSLPKALASLPSSPTKSITSLFSSPKRRNKDSIDSIRMSALDSPSTGSHSQSSDATSRTTTSSIEDGMIVGKRASTMFLGPETKEKGVVAGVRSFVEGLRDKEWQGIPPRCL